jgi:hypothetical protein
MCGNIIKIKANAKPRPTKKSKSLKSLPYGMGSPETRKVKGFDRM